MLSFIEKGKEEVEFEGSFTEDEFNEDYVR